MGAQLARALRCYVRRPPVVLQLALLAALLSAGIVVLMAVGSAQVLVSEGSEALPMVYLILAVVSVPLASGISAALARWSVARISGGVSFASMLVVASHSGWRSDLTFRVPHLPFASRPIRLRSSSTHSSGCPRLNTCRPSSLKRHTPFLAAAFGLGGIFAGFAATAFCSIFAGQDLLLLDAGFFALCVLQYRRIGRLLASSDEDIAEEAEPGVLKSLQATLGVVRAFPITGAIAAGVLLMSALFCLQDYLAMTTYENAFPDADELSTSWRSSMPAIRRQNC